VKSLLDEWKTSDHIEIQETVCCPINRASYRLLRYPRSKILRRWKLRRKQINRLVARNPKKYRFFAKLPQSPYEQKLIATESKKETHSKLEANHVKWLLTHDPTVMGVKRCDNERILVAKSLAATSNFTLFDLLLANQHLPITKDDRDLYWQVSRLMAGAPKIVAISIKDLETPLLQWSRYNFDYE